MEEGENDILSRILIDFPLFPTSQSSLLSACLCGCVVVVVVLASWLARSSVAFYSWKSPPAASSQLF